jgi:ribosomal protein L37AE/L43A
MELRSRNTPSHFQARPVVPCAQCGDNLLAPEWSEYLDDRRIRHLWSCDSCGYEFESTVFYPGPTTHAA